MTSFSYCSSTAPSEVLKPSGSANWSIRYEAKRAIWQRKISALRLFEFGKLTADGSCDAAAGSNLTCSIGHHLFGCSNFHLRERFGLLGNEPRQRLFQI